MNIFDDPDDILTCRICGKTAPCFHRARSFAPYDGMLRELILHYKFRHIPRLHIPLGHLLERVYRNFFTKEPIHVITHVPLHWRRRRERGFDQTELLARYLSRRTGLKHRRLLRKIRFTPPQSSLGFEQRTSNIRNAFTIRDRKFLKDKAILLIDDIYTTGSTLNECCRELSRGGAEKIYVLTLARVVLDA